MESHMQPLARLLLISILSLILSNSMGCGSCSESEATQDAADRASAAPAPAATTPEPELPPPPFDRTLLPGRWSASMEDAEGGFRMDIAVTYTDEEFEVQGEFIQLDSANGPEDRQEFHVAGNWTLEGAILTETAVESTFPLWRIGQSAPATVKTLDEKSFIFERSGTLMTLARDPSR